MVMHNAFSVHLRYITQSTSIRIYSLFETGDKPGLLTAFANALAHLNGHIPHWNEFKLHEDAVQYFHSA